MDYMVTGARHSRLVVGPLVHRSALLRYSHTIVERRVGMFTGQRNPFEHFTQRARAVLDLAQSEAKRYNHNYIGTEHLLLGLVREGEGVAARALTNLGIELPEVRSAVEFIIGRGERQVTGEIGLTPRARKVIELAVDEARRLGAYYVGTEHLLLGLVREGEGIAAKVMTQLNVTLDLARGEVISILTQAGLPVSVSLGPSAVSGPDESSGPPSAPPSLFTYRTVRTRRGVDEVVVDTVHPENMAEPGWEGAPIHLVLDHLGTQGWELMGIDATPEPGVASLYIFKRRAR